MTDPSTPKPDRDKSVAEDAKKTAKAATVAAKDRARDMTQTVANEAATYADQAKKAAVGEVRDVASALRTAADEMRGGSPQERTFSQIADSLADASDALREKDLAEMVGAINDFARRNPAIFLGSAALVGFAATRFAKASSDGSTRSGSADTAQRGRPSAPARPVPPSGRATGATTATTATRTVKGGTA